jgi:dihydrofolate synthase/folylpolyglutamate synthase
MTYEMALAYLAGLSESRIRPGLERIEKVLSFFGSPQLKFPHVLIGGTNGKGSVVTMMGSVLERTGLRVGRFTSPHLHRFEERIVVDGAPLPPDRLQYLVSVVRASNADLSYFEFATTMALLHFASVPVEIALLEVGLGGRWDATNATDPLLSVITSIAVDHERWLGDTIEKIAAEKAMIMRRSRPVVINGAEKTALKVLLDYSDSLNSHVILGGRDFSAQYEDSARTMRYTGSNWEMNGLRLGLRGRFQVENAATSLAALECLARLGFPVNRTAVAQGLAAARWPGRFEELGVAPKIIVDSAHNRAAARALVQSLDPGQDVVWLFSALEDKDLEGMTAEMLPLGQRFVLVPLDHPRACGLDEMVRRMPDGAEVMKTLSVGEGLRKAATEAGKDGAVVAAGSVFLASAVIEEVRGQIQDSGSRIQEAGSQETNTRNAKRETRNPKPGARRCD